MFSADEIAKLFPYLYGQPSVKLVPSEKNALSADRKLKIGVVLSGGQAPGGHNVISGIFGRQHFELDLINVLYYFCTCVQCS